MSGEAVDRRFTASGGWTIRVQSVLFNTPPEAIARALEYVDNAARIGRESGIVKEVVVAYGDCSPTPTHSTATLRCLGGRYADLAKIEYTFFSANLGSAAGHNRLLEDAAGDLVMIANPDILAAPTLFTELISTLGRPEVGLAEARQLPIEHPKNYDQRTGETSWASTACVIGPTNLFRELGGFDADTFFLYCDDVDLSWRVRLAGLKVIHQPNAVVYHDKRLNNEGGWMAGAAERYYSAEAGLLLPYKYSRSDLTEKYLDHFVKSADEYLVRAAKAFELRVKTGRLPNPIDPDHMVGQFINENYAHHRFTPR
jgi:GT2 family glycosyltransferase